MAENVSVARVGTVTHPNFPVLYWLVCLVCVLPVSTAGTERSFSAMKWTKTRLINGGCLVVRRAIAYGGNY